MKFLVGVLAVAFLFSGVFGFSLYSQLSDSRRVNTDIEEELVRLSADKLKIESDRARVLGQLQLIEPLQENVALLEKEKLILKEQLLEANAKTTAEADLKVQVKNHKQEINLLKAKIKELESVVSDSSNVIESLELQVGSSTLVSEDLDEESSNIDDFYSSAEEIASPPPMLPRTGIDAQPLAQLMALIEREPNPVIRKILRYYAYLEKGELSKAFALRKEDGRSFESFASNYETVAQIDLSDFEVWESDDTYKFLITYTDESVKNTVYRMVMRVIDGKVETLASWHVGGTGK